MKDRIKTLRKTLKMNQNEFANKIHKVTRTLQKYESGEIVPDYSIVQLIAKTFNVNPDWLVTGDGEMFIDNVSSQQELSDIISIPYYPEVSAAAGSGALVYDESTVKNIQISSAIINISTGDNVCLINATGNSMQPVIDDRDLLLVDLSQKLITDEGIYVIRLDTTLVVKRVQKILNGFILISDNPQYPPKEITAENFNENDAAVIGKVIAVIKNFNRNMI